MKEIEKNISYFVDKHFPSFMQEDGPVFIEFVKEYYRWAEQSNNFLYHSRNLINYKDVDKTVDKFKVYFQQKYLQGTQLNTDKTASEVKHSLDVYRSKGTERSVELLFKNSYDISDVEIYYPKKDILKASDGQWNVPVYLEVSLSERTKAYLGKEITGSSSGATAFVEGISRKSLRGKFVDVLYLSNVSGNFLFKELITDNGVLLDAPSVIGSLTSITMNDRGRDFEIGDIVDIVSSSVGKQGKARVTEVSKATGKVAFSLEDGGTGYFSNTTPIIADKMLSIQNISSSNVYVPTFIVDEIVTQPLANLVFGSSNVTFTVGQAITGANSTANLATGRIVGLDQGSITGTASANSTSNLVVGTDTVFINEIDVGDYIKFQACTASFQVSNVISNTALRLSTNGPNVTDNTMIIANSHMLVIVNSGSFSGADRIANTTAVISSYVNRSATGRVMGVSNTALGLISVSNTFTPNAYNFVRGNTSNVYANVFVVGTGSGAGFSIGSLSDEELIAIGGELIGGVNDVASPYLSLQLNALQYDFPRLPTGNSSFLIGQLLSKQAVTIGTISSLASVNPGSGYNFTPFVLLREQKVAQYNKKNIHLVIANSSGNFLEGESILQNYTTPAFTLSLSGSNTSFTVTEPVTQQINSTANASGEVSAANTSRTTITTPDTFIQSTLSASLTGTVSANGTSAQVNGVSTLFTSELSAGKYIKFSSNGLLYKISSITNNTVLTLTTNATPITGNTYNLASNVVIGLNSGSAFFVNTAVSNVQISVSRGLVINSTTQIVNLKRQTFNTTFTPGIQITGAVTGVTANVVSVTPIVESSVMGNNAIVTAAAGSANGEITTLTVVDSGYGYEDGEEVTITINTNPYVATGFANLINQGYGEGYFKSTRGFLNSDKYIHDGEFYQEYSYQVKSSLPLDSYSDVLKQLIHVAGTKLFGGIVKTSNAVVSISTSGLQIDT
jgi:hypothetical protein